MKLTFSIVMLVLALGCSKSGVPTRPAPSPSPCSPKIIANVGACNKNAYCSVMYTDYSFGYEYYPIALKEVCR